MRREGRIGPWQIVWVMMLCAALSACKLKDETGPTDQGPLRLVATISQAPVPPGETATITFRLENVSMGDIRFTFNSSCQILPYITDPRSGLAVYPAGGNWACATVITELTLRAGGSVQQEVKVRAADGAVTPNVVALPAGAYEAYARIDDLAFRLKSDPITFTLQ